VAVRKEGEDVARDLFQDRVVGPAGERHQRPAWRPASQPGATIS
jgi:hypothetical protein